nr:10945_t:CDS:2 [Entrophospora candida]
MDDNSDIKRCCCCIRLRPAMIIITLLWTLYGIWETYKYTTDAILKYPYSVVEVSIIMSVIYLSLTILSFFALMIVSTSKTKFLKIFKALAYTIAAFYSFVAMIPFIVLAAKKDEFTSSCFKTGYLGDCRTLINTMIVGGIINVIVLALYFAAIVKAYVLKMNTERRNSQRETAEETPKETNMETSSQPMVEVVEIMILVAGIASPCKQQLHHLYLFYLKVLGRTISSTRFQD